MRKEYANVVIIVKVKKSYQYSVILKPAVQFKMFQIKTSLRIWHYRLEDFLRSVAVELTEKYGYREKYLYFVSASWELRNK